MILCLWFLLYVTPVFESKCAQGYYYDGLLDDCQHCSRRCNSPPTVCATYCRPSTLSGSEAAQSNKFRIILIILLLTSVTCIMLTLIQVIRQKACRVMLLAKAQDRKMCANDKSSISTEQSDDADGPDSGSLDMEGMCHALYNSNLPLPSTEEGTTVLVTTKTCNL
ncbi:tumor necrosis factor receptor superfamily member 17 [Electrophorus electricus]|uniref:tumor necrosis factor receptor superfamily member 17 n=1 Tax=Electrophorus electricus TaxID=8005 RepID=UPI000F0A3125|nr:tumor necrosis factor receptor superfamily member 17 [Electrophorus electricus]